MMCFLEGASAMKLLFLVEFCRSRIVRFRQKENAVFV